MQSRLILRSLLLVLLTTCFTLTLQNSSPLNSKRTTNGAEEEKNMKFIVREKRATQKPGFFRTLFSVIYEQWTDTRKTFNSVNKMINDNFLPENEPVTKPTTTARTDVNVSTTAAPYKIKRSEFNRILQRNLRGLVRLFNIELQDALKQSERTRIEFRKNATKEVSKFL